MPVNYARKRKTRRLKQAEHIFATKLQLPNKKKGPRKYIEIKWLILMLVLENLVQNFKNKLRMQKNLKNDLMRIQCLFVIFSRPGKLFP